MGVINATLRLEHGQMQVVTTYASRIYWRNHKSMKTLRLADCAAVALLCFSIGAQAQCRTADAQSSNMMSYLTSLATASASDTELVATRARYHLPVVSASQVTLVANKHACSSALQAYTLLLPAGTPAPSSLYVVAVGSVFVAWTPATTGTEWALAVVFDSRFVKLESFAS